MLDARGAVARKETPSQSVLKRQPDRMPAVSPIMTPSRPKQEGVAQETCRPIPVDEDPKVGEIYRLEVSDALLGDSNRPRTRLLKAVSLIRSGLPMIFTPA
jgi:hypothetical protein